MKRYIKLRPGTKIPVETAWTSDPNSWYEADEAKNFESCGFAMTEDYIAIDADSPAAVAKVENVISKLGLKAISYKTDRGTHFWFKASPNGYSWKICNSNVSMLTEAYETNPSMYKKTDIDVKGYGGQVAIKVANGWRIHPTDLEEALRTTDLSEAPLILMINGTKLKMSVYDFIEGQRDELMYKNWVVKFRAGGFTKNEWMKTILEAAKLNDDKASPMEIAEWAAAKWDSSESKGPIEVKKFHGNQYSKEEINWGEIANTYIDQFGLVKINEVVMNKDGKYIKEMEIKNAIANDFPQKPATFADAVFDKIDQLLKNKEDIVSENFIYFQNGRFDIYKGTFEEGEYESFNKMPWNYISEAKSSYGEALMNKYEGNNKGFTTQIFEAVGMLASKKMLFKKTIFLDGVRDTGKSILTSHIITNAIGLRNLTTISLVNMDNQENAKLMGKTGAIDDDMEKDSWTSATKASFKKITGSEVITGKFLFRDKFDFVNYATLMINCNGLPKANDNGSGGSIETRIHVIKATVPMRKLYPNEKIAIEVKEKEKEISEWILYEACQALHKALERGSLTTTEASKEAMMEFKYENSTVFKWLNDTVKPNGWQFNKKMDAYMSYLDSFEKIPGNIGINIGSKAKNNQESFVNALKDFQEDFGYELEVKLGTLKLTWKEQN